MKRSRVAIGLLGGAALATVTTSALAQDRRSRDELLEPFTSCGAIADNAARLACFDAAVASLDERVAAVEEREATETIAGFGLRDEDEPTDEAVIERQAEAATLEMDEKGDATLRVVVEEVFSAQGGRQAILLANGQLWREGSNSSLRSRVKPGWVAEITKGGIGGYRMRFEGKTGFLSVTRVR